MTILSRGTYIINFTKTAYINAIARYNQKSSIDKLIVPNKKSIALSLAQSSLSNLPILVQELSASNIQQITINYITGNSSSMFNGVCQTSCRLYYF